MNLFTMINAARDGILTRKMEKSENNFERLYYDIFRHYMQQLW